MTDFKTDENLPNSLRWFLSQNLHNFSPWTLLGRNSQYEFITEGVGGGGAGTGKVYVFARREDNGNFAGLEIVGNKITDRVVCFHPYALAGESELSWNVVNAVYEDVFVFVGKQVMPDMQAMAREKDAADLFWKE
ncbi:hypothetical protein [Idiomarina sp.]|uniref:hypothetical protein n=1 Tax=Idiomarina sp. TaxID=1874361 RepID=UPI003A956573